MLLTRSMEKEILLVLILICSTQQRPQQDTSTTTEATDSTSEETKSSEKVAQVTEPAAVSVQTSVNVSSSSSLPSRGPSKIYEDFKPSNYYRPDGDPIFERPSPQVTHEVFYKPQYFSRPSDVAHRPRPVSDDKSVVFPQASRENHSEHQQHNNNKSGPESRSPQKFTDVLPQFKPIKHDSGHMIPNFSLYDNFYERNLGKYHGTDNNLHERNLGKYHGNEMSHYPEIIHAPPPPNHHYHSVAKQTHSPDPWKGVLSVVAKLLPLGLLLAAFPASVIKVNSTQFPYQFQKNATQYQHYPNYPNVMVGKFKALRKTHAGRKVVEKDQWPEHLDDCLKKKLCESIKTNYSPNELNSLIQNNELNSTARHSSPMVEIAETAASTSPESCRVFVCSN